ncbi:bactofilin family protein [Stenoxybacter acetivorans]|uniref:bactofilin family protein n=1 Tax=Stenoxybacter acetivorans TaxID=422441 RepID=UPI0005679087|nr:polymer-forming cytoskeletal protein [Stenoxybacter acetivorans]
MFGSSKKSGRESVVDIETLIGEHCSIEGRVNSPNSIKIEGGVVGNVTAENTVIIGNKGWVKGPVQAKEIRVFGRIEGNVKAQMLNLQSGAHILGNIDTQSLEVEPGAVYQGNITMHGDGNGSFLTLDEKSTLMLSDDINLTGNN